MHGDSNSLIHLIINAQARRFAYLPNLRNPAGDERRLPVGLPEHLDAKIGECAT
jgi:hypothetical protein